MAPEDRGGSSFEYIELSGTTTIVTDPPERPVYIITDKELTPSEMEELSSRAGIPTLDRRGAVVSKVFTPNEDEVRSAAAAARIRVLTEYNYKGHIIYPPWLASLSYYNCSSVVVLGNQSFASGASP
jgi:hypothetical protein